MSQPEQGERVAAEHDSPQGRVAGWSASDFSRSDYVGDEQTEGLAVLFDGTHDHVEPPGGGEPVAE